MQFRPVFDNSRILTIIYPGEDLDEFEKLQDRLTDTEYLKSFFEERSEDLRYFRGVTVNKAVLDTCDDYDHLFDLISEIKDSDCWEEYFEPLDKKESGVHELRLTKGKRKGRPDHDSWIRVYAIRLEAGIYIITGGGIKLTRAMQEDPLLTEELFKLYKCREKLEEMGILKKENIHEYANEAR